MAKLRVARDVLLQAKDRSNLTGEERATVERILAQGGGKGPLTADINTFPVAFLRALLDDTRLTANQRAMVSIASRSTTPLSKTLSSSARNWSCWATSRPMVRSF